jgi:hypothetical protein
LDIIAREPACERIPNSLQSGSTLCQRFKPALSGPLFKISGELERTVPDLFKPGEKPPALAPRQYGKSTDGEELV